MAKEVKKGRKKKRTPAQQVGDFLDEFGLKQEAKQAAADILKEGIRMTREGLLNQQGLPSPDGPWYFGEQPGHAESEEPVDPVNPFVLLGVREDAPEEVVQAAYRARVKKAHPDIAGGDSEEFQLIKDAWDWIKEKRGWS